MNQAGSATSPRCLCAGTLHPLDAVDAARRRLVPLRALLHIAETARRSFLALPEDERDTEADCHAWWERSVPGEVYVGGVPVDVLLSILAEYDEIVAGLIRCVEQASSEAPR